MFALIKHLALLITPLCMVGLSIFAVLGTTIPVIPDSLFSVCMLPCVGGLVPGKTDFAAAAETLAQNYPALSFVTPVEDSNASPIMFSLQLDNRVVNGMITGTPLVRTLSLSSDFSVIQLLELLGSPNCMYHERIIQSVSTSVILQWRFEDAGVTASAFIEVNPLNQWGAYATARSLRLSVSDIPCRSGRLEPHDWRGFPLFWWFRFED